MPPKVTYEDDDDVDANNLRNNLFQFRCRPVYDNNQKSVWGASSIVPLPNQSSLILTTDDVSSNARISVSFFTGGPDVKKVELAFRQFQNGATSDWMLINSFDKAELSIPDDDVYNFKFLNDSVYTPIDVLDTTQLQDYVPLRANAGELLNGNTPIYGGLLEGYDPIPTDLSVQVGAVGSGFYYDYNGLLFFAVIEGLDSGSQGTIMKVYVYGTGTNTTGVVTTLNNANATFKINAVNANTLSSIGVSVNNATDTVTVATLLGNISAALVLQGWTQVSLVGNVLTVSFPTDALLYSSGTTLNSASANNNTTSFAYPFQGAGDVGVMYFDSFGRTNGTLTNVGSSFVTGESGGANNFPEPKITIENRPPIWAYYYAPVRTNTTTYEKRLEWISQSAYSSGLVAPPGLRVAYLGISNIEEYNEQIEATEGVVSYEFQQGDRVRMFYRYTATGSIVNLTRIVDYEVLGTETNPKIDGQIKEGRFVKIYYPSNDIDSNLKFDGTDDFIHYRILLYSIKKHVTGSEQTYYEFGRMFGIGNAGTVNSYHIGLDQTQSVNLVTPAIIGISNGDLFYRQRTVPYGETFTYVAGGTDQDETATMLITVPTTVTNSSYEIQSQAENTVLSLTNPAVFPTYADTPFFFNKLNTVSQSRLIRLRGTFTVYNNVPELSTWNVGVIICTNLIPFATKYFQYISTPNTVTVQSNENYTFDIDIIISVPPTGKVFPFIGSTSATIGDVNVIGAFNLTIDVLNSATIEIIENTFSDVYGIVTSSNGRPTVIEENAKQTYFPAMVRFGQAYQENTNINGTNRFFAENFDDYDRSFGDIMRLHVRDRYMKTYQKLKVGNVPILTQIVKDATGNILEANSDKIINKIQYYSGDYGIGDVPCSLAWDNFADYFVDNYRGVVCRLSQDGITPISIVYQTNAFFVRYLPQFRQSLNNGNPPTGQPYTGNATVYGTFDAYTNKYIVALEEINRYDGSGNIIFHQDSFTLSFDEVNNRFESQLSYKPEWLGCLNTLLVSAKNGTMYTHNSGVYCDFYGIQYDAYIETVFNTAALDKKTWISLMETGNVLWECPSIQTQLNTYGATPQQSVLIRQNFQLLEGEYSASFRRDSNSTGGLINGSSLKGGYIIIKFRISNANQFVFLNSVSVSYIDSPLNKK